MIRRLLSWLFGLPTLIILLLFALANRQMVQVSLDPLTPEDPWLAITLPLWAVFFAGVLLGLLVGGAAAWVKQGKWRKLARKSQQDLELERVARKRAEEKAAAAQAPVATPAATAAAPAATAATTATPALPASAAAGQPSAQQAQALPKA